MSQIQENILSKINNAFTLTKTENSFIAKVLSYQLNYERIATILTVILDSKLGLEAVIAFLYYQLFKLFPQEAEQLTSLLNDDEKMMVEDFKSIKDINQLTLSEEIEDVKRMFIVMSKDMRVVIIKLAGIYYDISVLERPLNQNQKNFVKQVKEIHVPLAERLGLDKLKQNLYDNVVRLEYPQEYYKLKMAIESQREENEKQLETTHRRLQAILDDLKIDGQIISRIKHISSIFNKLHNKKLTLDQIYDILAMRVIVSTVEECYAVLGRVHAIYKPMQGRVKDYIANPKPNGYKSLHTTVIVENQHPLEIQIRTVKMNEESEYGGYAHWLYKEKKSKKDDFDNRLTWFRQTIENAKNMSNQEFIDTLKSDLYSGVIIVQTPKGRVIEFPEGSTAIDFAYAIHSDIGNSCVGAKINGKLKPLTTKMCNGDIIEIITNSHSKGPSRDWLKYVKTASARSKIKSFFKSELKEENIRLGKTMFNQAVQDRGYITSQLLKDEYLDKVFRKYNFDNLDEFYAAIGSGSVSGQSMVSRLIDLFNKTSKALPKLDSVVHLKRNKEGVLIDGDSGMLVRFAGCCNPVEGDEIIGYISRGKGVALHRKTCPNLKYLEPERLIEAKWQPRENATFATVIKIIADKGDSNIAKFSASIASLKITIKGLDVKEVEDSLICTLIVDVKNKEELDSIMNSLSNIKNVISVQRSEG